jgi:ketosteroid isomerase-like protein
VLIACHRASGAAELRDVREPTDETSVLKRTPLIGAFALLLAAPPVSAQADADAARIRVLRAESNDAIARHDVPGIVSFLDDEFQVTAGSGAMLQGRDEMGAAFAGQFEDFDDVVYVRRIESVEISTSAPLAAEIGTWIGTWTTPRGPLRTGGRYSASWRKSDGSWSIRSELFVTLFCEGSGCQ